jgi:hypothetical protein
MLRFASSFVALGLVLGLSGSPAQASVDLFTATLRGNRANQVIAGFPSSTVDWDLDRGRASILPFGKGHALVVVRTVGLIIPALGFNPSPDILARVVCHDATGAPFEAARTDTAPFPSSGDALLIDVVTLRDPCFAPIVLVTGSIDPAGNRPGNWFAVSGF